MSRLLAKELFYGYLLGAMEEESGMSWMQLISCLYGWGGACPRPSNTAHNAWIVPNYRIFRATLALEFWDLPDVWKLSYP